MLTRPWARYVRRRCLGAWLTWMCLTIRLPVSRPLVSALASAFLSRPRRNSADLTGHRARETPNCFPVEHSHQHLLSIFVRLLRLPPSLAPFLANILTLCGTSSSTSVSPHGHGLLVLDDIVEESLCPLQLPAIDGLGGLSGVLEAHTKVGSPRAGALRRVNLRRCVSNLPSQISLDSNRAAVAWRIYTMVVGDGVSGRWICLEFSQDFDFAVAKCERIALRRH